MEYHKLQLALENKKGMAMVVKVAMEWQKANVGWSHGLDIIIVGAKCKVGKENKWGDSDEASEARRKPAGEA